MKFTPATCPDAAIRRARERNPHHPHSLIGLVIDSDGQHILCGQPASAQKNGAAVLVPPQERYQERGEGYFLPALAAARKLMQPLLSYRLATNHVRYLGWGFGNRHLTPEYKKRHAKYVHVFAHIVPRQKRRRAFHTLLKNTDTFNQVQWLRIDDFVAMHVGGTVSDEKVRLVMQSLWVLCNQTQSLRESAAARTAGRHLQPDLIPKVA